MMIVWGKPTTFATTIPYVNTTIDWDDCVQLCYNFTSCVVAFQNSTGCNLFPFNSVPVIQKTNSTEGSIIAFKVDNSDTQCPSGTDAPTFNNQNATGYLFVTDNTVWFPTTVNYTISLAGSNWKISYTSIPMCSSSYTNFYTLPNGKSMCFVVYYSNSTLGLFQNSSLQTCKSINGNLPTVTSSVENGAFTWLVNLYIKFFKSSSFYVRIDGKRTTACQSTPKTAACMSPSGFTFTDPHFLGNFNYYNWTTNAGARVESDDDCLVLVFPSVGTSYVDVRSCTIKGKLQALGLLCVKDAWTA
ncbi:PAN-3 domain-containing protein [Caenorhabditis elegans]|uniref:PAN-3 domain-containing protein n=1 Tax=Caenorhabditis elegans TaxID=6239 RepID=A0T4F4_CAEEL|nr:PAN-3 domain-containing protein [Caenorhabditis elegans]CAL69738.4 PAN-3 domain-containing protein [Caenorhabditis elegans]|eukprot:NP_001076684.4 Uncharacterized protein CELE_F22B3.10 [Caenorhabditis elegans]